MYRRSKSDYRKRLSHQFNQACIRPQTKTGGKTMSMYTVKNFRTKKELKEAVAKGEHVEVYQPGPFGSGIELEGSFCAEGPHYPEPHRWYASIEVEDGKVVSVK